MMTQPLKTIFQWLCPHRFSWPRSGSHGEDYQVCLICGTSYAYDWSSMRRTRRLDTPDENAQTVVRTAEDY